MVVEVVEVEVVVMVEVMMMMVIMGKAVVMVGATTSMSVHLSVLPVYPQTVEESLQKELCPRFLLPSTPGENHAHYPSGIIPSNISTSQMKEADPGERPSACHGGGGHRSEQQAAIPGLRTV